MKGIILTAVMLTTTSAFAFDSSTLGTIIGSVGAGVTANQISKDKPTNIKNRNTVLATIAGGLVGNMVGSAYEAKDQAQAQVQQQGQIINNQQQAINAEIRREVTFEKSYTDLFKKKTTNMKQEAADELNNICAQGAELHLVLPADLPVAKITDYVDCIAQPIRRSPSLHKAVVFTARKATQ